ncbi:MAG TPA: CsgG/HfaB family protein [Chitinivibrionales bacterium]|nr:CsgG/HfaB family protein [Chitinivibrionales bacterium]
MNNPAFLTILSCALLAFGGQTAKETIAVMTLHGSSGITKDECELLSDRLRVEFFKTNMVDVMEREQMAEILKEQGFQQSGACTNESCLIEMGQILGVKKLVSGSIGKVGSLYLLNVRLIDIKTAKISKTVSEDVKGDLEEVVGRLADVARRLFEPEKVQQAAAPQPGPKEVERRAEPRKEEAQPATPGSLDCDGRAFIELVPFDKAVLGFDMEESDWKEAYDKMAGKLRRELRHGADTASSIALDNAKDCKAIVLRPHLESYSTKPARLGQKEGTIRITFAVFPSPSAAQPAFSVTAEATGERHWHDVTPFINACEELGKELGKQLRRSDAFDKLDGGK